MQGDTISPGTVLGHFEIFERLGAGGFGEVYRAKDTKLARDVAVKVLPEAFLEGEEGKKRFEREARALAAFNHPNIAAIYSFEEIGGKYLIVMELLDGKTLHTALKDGPLPLPQLLPIALQVTAALGEAHRAGILHRDIKPANIALTSRGQVKVLDFGIAKLAAGGSVETEGSTVERLTEEGSVFGTLSYMSPEQLLSKPLDRRSDLFSLGVVLYEMATGRLPFEGTSKIATADAILHSEPCSFDDRPIPGKLKPIVLRLLQKDPEKRYASAEGLSEDLVRPQESRGPRKPGGLSRGAQIAIAAGLLVVAMGAGWYWRKSSRERWALAQIPEIARLVEVGDWEKALPRLREVRAVLPKDPVLERQWMKATIEITLDSSPPGADVLMRSYRGPPTSWQLIGRTPLVKTRAPRGEFVWRVEKNGFVGQSALGIPEWSWGTAAQLDQAGSVPDGMLRVRVKGGKTDLSIPGLDQLPEVPLDDYLIDRIEVTNREFKRFVDAGGYEKREFWKQPFVKGARTVPWEEAVVQFRDSAGRPGPATWEAGAFPKEHENHPVAGVSWYEAAAYAEFAGKSLPTIYHWNYAAQPWLAGLIVPGSNFSPHGTVPVGSENSLGGFGTSDMAGNVKEWCFNESLNGKKFILGGGFGEPSYMFIDPDAQSPWDRRPNFGFRCVKLASPPSAVVAGRIEPAFRDYSKERPVSDDVFAAYKGLYSYDKGELNVRLEETETTEEWTREKVSFDAAYGGERVATHVFLPKGVPPPYQTVVIFPPSNAIFMDSLPLPPNEMAVWGLDFILRSGRALVHPVFKSTFERRDGLTSDVQAPTAAWRDHMIMWAKDLGRSLDYLETRKDVDRARLAYLGYSWGGVFAPVALTLQDRFRAAILLGGGFSFTRALPEADPINFVTHVKVPVVMVNGLYDAELPVESSQRPFFRLLGTPDKDKRHVVSEFGHPARRQDAVRESLDWLDKYLGPVRK